VAATPPPWRVFDAPADHSTPDHATSEPEGPTTAGAASAASVAAAFRHPGTVAGLVAAGGGFVLAAVLAMGGPAQVSVDAVGGGPLDSPASSALEGAGPIVVNVVGAVVRPGVYRLPTGARVADAIAAAGGFGPRVAAGRVDRELNLAAVVHDGDRILVPSRDDTTATEGSTAASGGNGSGGAGSGPTLIDLNTATEAELDTLPGIGPVTAAKIVAARSEAPFRSVDELLERKVVGPATFDKIKALVTVR
jgi:competence protein ComEA